MVTVSTSPQDDLTSPLQVLCPLDFERSVLARHWRRARPDASLEIEFHVCGPGSGGVRRWFQREDAETPRRSRIVLAGTAGSLSAELSPGTALVAERVIDAQQRTWWPNLEAPKSLHRDTILSIDETLCESWKKRRRGEQTGAAAVDLESAAFAECCEARGLEWSVVRGISDALTDPLPADVDRWIDARGRLRSFQVLVSSIRTPSTIAVLPRLRSSSILALHAVAGSLAHWNSAAVHPRILVR